VTVPNEASMGIRVTKGRKTEKVIIDETARREGETG
jgi:hypothetical protein